MLNLIGKCIGQYNFNRFAQNTSVLVAWSQASARQFLGGSIIVTADPNSVRSAVWRSNTVKRQSRRYFLVGGNWDRDTKPFGDTLHAKEIAELFESDFDPTKTASYKYRLECMHTPSPTVFRSTPLDTVEKIHSYYERVNDLIRSIKANGFVTPNSFIARAFESQYGPLTGERDERLIGIAVDRDGRLIHYNKGHHRLAIAQRLGLSAIPMEVRFAHIDWARRAVVNGVDHAQSIARALSAYSKSK